METLKFTETSRILSNKSRKTNIQGGTSILRIIFLTDKNLNDISNDIEKTMTLNEENIKKLDKIEMNNNRTQETEQKLNK